MRGVDEADYKFPHDYKNEILDAKGLYWDFYNNVVKKSEFP